MEGSFAKTEAGMSARCLSWSELMIQGWITREGEENREGISHLR